MDSKSKAYGWSNVHVWTERVHFYPSPLPKVLEDLHYCYYGRLSVVLHTSFDTKARWCIKNGCPPDFLRVQHVVGSGVWKRVQQHSAMVGNPVYFILYIILHDSKLIYGWKMKTDEGWWWEPWGGAWYGTSIWTICSSLNFRTVAQHGCWGKTGF